MTFTIATSVAQLIGGPVRQLPMTAERVWDAMQQFVVQEVTP